MRSLSKMLVTGYLLNNKDNYVLASSITGHSVLSLNSKNKIQEYKKNQEHKVAMDCSASYNLKIHPGTQHLDILHQIEVQNETPLGNLEI